ncbi:TPA: rod shape-determining protein MreC [Streptococcus suis]|uniref:rod shape-determining protein MreC n=1 Tax=Streptococcus parasuis TaxID=1501662 RepID=UPI0028A06FE4|nr:rod shape-determining protein MreC [Streptococcus parasuis]NCB79464.1 rod shape-determining protein MreC [Bacilli bacterium]
MNKLSKLIIAFFVFLILSFSLLFVTTSGSHDIPFLSSIVSGVMTPIEKFFSPTVSFITAQRTKIEDLFSTFNENQELKQSIASLENISEDNETLRLENESLRKDLGIVASFPEKSFLSSFVLVRNPVSWTEQLIIDAGTEQGVVENMLVVANGGLAGIVTNVESSSANVKLLTNSDEFTKIPVKISTQSGDIYGILSGYDSDSNSFVVNQLNSMDEIKIDSNVVTSDLAGTTPANIQVGKVKSISSTSNNLNREVFIEPTTDFSEIYSVLLVEE